MNETFSRSLPNGDASGPVTVTATVWYSKLVASVAEFLNVPADEAEPVKMSDLSTTIEVIPKSS